MQFLKVSFVKFTKSDSKSIIFEVSNSFNFTVYPFTTFKFDEELY